MNITWIVGNGFDLNLGLDTTYRSFLENCYLIEANPPYREKLIEAAGCPTLSEGQNWCDLEKMVGIVSSAYEGDEETFHQTFQEMIRLFKGYLEKEQQSFEVKMLSEQQVEEFRDSLTNFTFRSSQKDRKHFKGYRENSGRNDYRIINLNYTRCFDELILACIGNDRSIERRRQHNAVYTDYVGTIQHPHGSLRNDDLVFGICESSQWASESFSQDEDARRLWEKTQRNDFYGNAKTERLIDVIDQSDVICMFGVSLGETDSYIWNKVGAWLGESAAHLLVFFEFGYPPKSSDNLFECIKAEKDVLARLKHAFGSHGEGIEEYRNQILIEPSENVFRFDE